MRLGSALAFTRSAPPRRQPAWLRAGMRIFRTYNKCRITIRVFPPYNN